MVNAADPLLSDPRLLRILQETHDALAFTDGKLYFSKEYPALYLQTPEVYAAKDQLVLKLHVAGPVHRFGFDSQIDGDVFFVGHPVVEDNELRVPDLEPTVETKSLLLKLKAALEGDSIRDDRAEHLRRTDGRQCGLSMDV